MAPPPPRPTKSSPTSEFSSFPTFCATPAASPLPTFEWVQDRQGYFWKEAVVNEQLEDIMVERLRRRSALLPKPTT